MLITYLTRTWQTIAVAIAACALCFILGQRDGQTKGRKLERAEWQSASTRIQSAAIRMRDAADTLAKQREQRNTTEITELRHEAAKGTDDHAGPGVSAVLDRLRAQQGR